MAPIVFVTPESAVTKGFSDFVNRLQARSALDRVVIDECHTILDSTHRFRPQMMELGQVLNEWGVQKVFLTATLPPSEVGRFCEVAKLPVNRVKIYRSRTSRSNIRYRVIEVHQQAGPEEEAEDIQTVKTVRDWLHQHNNGRVIVYASTIDRVERLGKMLECNVYLVHHTKINSTRIVSQGRH
ncbi:P-loop containing nucleoside triphosphate hydrolase protein [Fusarium sp. MPI-SDFR-AT-0072]|nr:P-loop containing nucleoside triphosphate hydrolase protein [Fusarium sp. MPI-SDFR-AT-0072]